MDNLNPICKQIWELAKPHLNTRSNDLHTKVSTELAIRLLKGEGGDEDIVIPAILLHDTGWICISEEDQLKAYGPHANAPEVTLRHEKEGAKIADEILEKVEYDKEKIQEIIDIIDGHDSRQEALSLNDSLVKDADKLSRYDKGMLAAWDKKLKLDDPVSAFKHLKEQIEVWFFTDTAKKIASENIEDVLKI